MTVTDHETTVLDELDVEIPCDRCPEPKPAARWAVIWRAIPACCPGDWLTICDGHRRHLDHYVAHDALLICPHGPIGAVRDHLVRIEPLDRP